MREARDADAINHPGLLGRIRELAATRLVAPVLPAGFQIGTGKVTDHLGNLSREVDLVVHHRGVLPPVLYSERDGVFPIESAYYAIEIKSTATLRNLQGAVEAGRDLLALDWHHKDKARTHERLAPAVLVYFAFGTDLAQPGLAELERYSRCDPHWKTDPVLKALCVVGSGYWYFHYKTCKWEFHPATEDYDEVIDFLGNMINTLASAPPWGRAAFFGKYIMEPRTVFTINNLPT